MTTIQIRDRPAKIHKVMDTKDFPDGNWKGWEEEFILIMRLGDPGSRKCIWPLGNNLPLYNNNLKKHLQLNKNGSAYKIKLLFLNSKPVNFNLFLSFLVKIL